MFHHTTSVLGLETRRTLTTEKPPAGLRNDSLILGSNESRLGSGFTDGWDGAEKDNAEWNINMIDEADDFAEALLSNEIDPEIELLIDTGSDKTEDSEDTEGSDEPDDSGDDTPDPLILSDTADPLHDPNVD